MSFFNRNNSVQSNQSPNTRRPKDTMSMGTVYKIILDISDDILSDLEIEEPLKGKYIGAILFRASTSQNKKDEGLTLALPKDKTSVSLPTINETVAITNSPGGGYLYERTIGSALPNVNTSIDEINASQKKEKSAKSNTASNYSNVQSTGISRTENSSDSVDVSSLGEYFKPDGTIHKLKLYEGDYLIESRFGQSIRFSGYNNPDNIFSPNIIIRNGENGESLTKDIGTSTEESINDDGNIIFLGSGERILEYKLPTENEYPSFFNYPSELKGNQILLNSDRVIVSAKAAEMIFSAKKDIGFITDAQFSIDATDGINITTDNHIFVDTQNRDINLDIGNGTIMLGTDGELEAAPKGETLVELLGEMIDLITQQIFLTPSGPTSPGPTNVAQFTTLKSKLQTMLSNNVQLK